MLLISIMFWLFVSAQSDFSKKFKIETGSPYKVIDASLKLYYPVNGESAIAIKVSGELVTLQLFDVINNLEVKRNEYIDFPKYSKLQDIIEIKGKMYYFFEAFHKKNDNFSVYCREIDKKNARFGRIRKLFTTKGVVVGTIVDPLDKNTIIFPGVRLGPKFKIQKSLDESKIMISYRNKPKVKRDRKNNDVIGVYVFNSEFKKLWNHEVKMPYTEAEIENIAYGVSGNGTVFIIIYNVKDKTYSALTFNDTGNLIETKLDIDGTKIVNELEMVESENGNIIFSGFYTNLDDLELGAVGDTDNENSPYGILSFEFDNKGSVILLRDLPFSNAFIKEYQSSKKQKKSKMRKIERELGYIDLKMIDFYVGENGSFYYVGEQQFAKPEYDGMDSKGRPDDLDLVLYFRNLVLVKTNAEGSIEWVRKLPKFQTGKFGRGSLGTFYSKSKSKHYFLFLDNPENIDVSINEAPEMYRGKDGVLSAFVVNDDTGEFNKYQILSLDNVNGKKTYKFITKRIFSPIDDILFFEVYIKNKKDMLVKLKLEEQN